MRQFGFGAASGLGTWESTEVSKGDVTLRITAMPGQHAPGMLSAALPEVMGTLLEFRQGGARAGTDGDAAPSLRLYITGDTIMYDGLAEIAERHPEIDIALLHLGGTRVMGLTVSMDAEQGVELLRTVQPRTAIPIHYADYEAFKSPLSDFVTLVNEAGLAERVSYVLPGDRFLL